MQTLEERITERDQQLDKCKDVWLPLYELISEYIMQRRLSFMTEHLSTPQQFIPERVFDSTASKANLRMASSLIGALYPGGEKTFKLMPPLSMEKDVARSKEVKEWYEWATSIIQQGIDNSKSGFDSAHTEVMNDLGSFGLSGIAVFDNYHKDPNCPLSIMGIDLRNVAIAENANGVVDTVYLKVWKTVRQCVQEFGYENLSKRTQDAFKDHQLDEKVKILHAIEPNADFIDGFQGTQGFEISSIIMERDNNHIIARSGFHDMPVFMVRFIKVLGEVYGRSPGMYALPDIFELNNRREASIIAVEKFLDPPLILDPDQLMGNNTVDTSAGAVNIKKVSGRTAPHDKAVETMITVGELRSTDERIDELQENVEDWFFTEDMTDLNNEHRQTLGEANIRDRLRGQRLVPVYKRMMNELYDRLIERAFNIYMLHGLLGYIEDSQDYRDNMKPDGTPPRTIPNAVSDLMMAGQDCYRIYYLSPAARIMRTDELTGLQQMTTAISEIEGQLPMTMASDNVDWDEWVRVTQELTGGPSQVLRAQEDVDKLRQQRHQTQMQQMAGQQKEQMAHTAKAAAQAAKAAAEAGIDPMQLLGGGEAA